jgi:vanillate O-demethylase monooxygenase subunit
MFIPNRWYAAGWSHELGEALLPRMICGEPLVMYRTASGHVAAIADRCPHRRMPLSRGRLIGDEVECAYHGMRFAPTGQCVFAPGLPRLPTKPLVRSYRIEERHGFVWIWNGEEAKADPDMIPDYHWHALPDWEADHFHVRIAANYKLGLDNLLDLSHAAYVHRANVGNAAIAEHDPEIVATPQAVEVRRTMRDVENSRTMGELTGLARSDNLRSTIFKPPGDVRIETIYQVGNGGEVTLRREIQVLTPLTPETESSHHQFLAHCRDFIIEPERRARFVADIDTVLAEDKAILEAQQQAMQSDPPGVRMLNLRIDRGPLAARDLLHSLERPAS